jgi:hypothetical protein
MKIGPILGTHALSARDSGAFGAPDRHMLGVGAATWIGMLRHPPNVDFVAALTMSTRVKRPGSAPFPRTTGSTLDPVGRDLLSEYPHSPVPASYADRDRAVPHRSGYRLLPDIVASPRHNGGQRDDVECWAPPLIDAGTARPVSVQAFLASHQRHEERTALGPPSADAP